MANRKLKKKLRQRLQSANLDTCPICLEVATPPVLLIACRHIICGECLLEIISRYSANCECPLCRQHFVEYVVPVEARQRALAVASDEARAFDAHFMANFQYYSITRDKITVLKEEHLKKLLEKDHTISELNRLALSHKLQLINAISTIGELREQASKDTILFSDKLKTIAEKDDALHTLHLARTADLHVARASIRELERKLKSATAVSPLRTPAHDVRDGGPPQIAPSIPTHDSHNTMLLTLKLCANKTYFTCDKLDLTNLPILSMRLLSIHNQRTIGGSMLQLGSTNNTITTSFAVQDQSQYDINIEIMRVNDSAHAVLCHKERDFVEDCAYSPSICGDVVIHTKTPLGLFLCPTKGPGSVYMSKQEFNQSVEYYKQHYTAQRDSLHTDLTRVWCTVRGGEEPFEGSATFEVCLAAK